jgi:hypothetical protein
LKYSDARRFPGVSNWKPAVDVLKALEVKTVRLAFDADAKSNMNVARPLKACAASLAAEGFAVEVETWLIEQGKGIDDLLARGARPTVLTGEVAVESIKETAKVAGVADDRPEADGVLRRLQEELGDGGATALFCDDNLLKALARVSVDDPPTYAVAREIMRREGVKLRDVDLALRKFVRDAKAESPAERPHAATRGFLIADGCLCRAKPTIDGPVIVAMTNFVATIDDETTRDDGVERRIVLGISGKLASGGVLVRIEVPGELFQRMEWVISGWGSRAIVLPGEHRALPAAIQLLSHNTNRQTVYTHSGWRKIDREWVYLHGGGAIGAHGPIPSVLVALPDPLARYCFTEIPTGAVLVTAVRASLRILGLCPEQIAFPILGMVYRSVLRCADFSGHIVGPTGAFKSELAALAQQHFGAELERKRLPGSWSSTGNALEGIAFAAKDALFVVDDFAPTGSAANVQRMHADADRLLRAQGNNSGRQRMRPDGGMRPTKPPRGLILSTGEDVPRGQSLRARLLTLEVSLGEIPAGRLTACQADAAAGLYAQSMAAFIRWAAARYDQIQADFDKNLSRIRGEIAAGGHHARTPGIVAELTIGLRLFLEFAVEAGAITLAEEQNLRERGWQALIDAADAQATHQIASEPAQHFLRLIRAALASGRAHVADPDGNPPQQTPQAWGWRSVTIGSGDKARVEWQPQGRRIGWFDDADLLLEPEASFAEAQRLAGEQGQSLTVQQRTLSKRLKESGMLVSHEASRDRLTIRRTVEGSRKEVLHLSASLILDSIVPTVPQHRVPDELGRSGRSETAGEGTTATNYNGGCTGFEEGTI